MIWATVTGLSLLAEYVMACQFTQSVVAIGRVFGLKLAQFVWVSKHRTNSGPSIRSGLNLNIPSLQVRSLLLSRAGFLALINRVGRAAKEGSK